MSQAVTNYVKSLNWGHRVKLRDKFVHRVILCSDVILLRL